MPANVHGDDFVLVHSITGYGRKAFLIDMVKKGAEPFGKGVEIVKEDAGSVKRQEFREGEFVSYGGQVFVAFPLADLDLIGSVIKVSLLRSWMKSDEGDVAAEGHLLVLEDGVGDCVAIAGCGPVEGNDRKIMAAVESLMVKTADPFGDF
jgi:hypothetical protein